MLLEPVNDCFDQWEGLSESKYLSGERHVRLHSLKLVNVVNCCPSCSEDWHKELDEVLDETTHLKVEGKDGKGILLYLCRVVC